MWRRMWRCGGGCGGCGFGGGFDGCGGCGFGGGFGFIHHHTHQNDHGCIRLLNPP